jgi:hypothetical protein
MRIERPNTERPSAPFQVNWASPQAQGLVAWYPGADKLDYLTGLYSLSGAASAVASPYGLVLQSASGTPTVARAAALSVPCTFSVWFKSTSIAATQALIVVIRGVTNDHFSLLADGAAAGDPVRAQHRRQGGSSLIASSTTGFSVGEWYLATAVFASLSERRAYINGGSKASETTLQSAFVTPLDTTCLGTRPDGFPLLGNIFDGRIYNRALSDEEVRALYDPRTRWDLYRQPPRRVWAVPAPAFNPAWAGQSNQILGGGF